MGVTLPKSKIQGISSQVHKVLEKIISAETLSVWSERDGENQIERLLEPQNPNGMKQSAKTTRLQTYITFYEKERMTQSLEGKAFSYRGLVLEPET